MHEWKDKKNAIKMLPSHLDGLSPMCFLFVLFFSFGGTNLGALYNNDWEQTREDGVTQKKGQ
jgi:hypothetical protein